MQRRAFTITELLVVISIIGLLMAMALGALTAVRSTDQVVTSQHHLRQIAQWMEGWSTARNDVVLPASFDLRDEKGTDPGETGGRRYFTYGNDRRNWLETNIPWQPASGDPRADLLSQGTWADILWVDAGIGDASSIEPPSMFMPDGSTIYADTTYSTPGRWLYDENTNDRRNPLRSTAMNTYNYPRELADGSQTVENQAYLGLGSPPTGMPLPFGNGAWEKDRPGFFAANNFFEGRSLRDRTGNNADTALDPRWTHGQIKAPARSMYLVDSFAGETIGAAPDEEDYREATETAFITGSRRNYDSPQQVDFRYGEQCLMLMLDGTVRKETTWGVLENLQGAIADGPMDESALAKGRGIRVTNLHMRRPW